MSTDRIDHLKLGLSRIAMQYRESPKFRALLTELLTRMQTVEDAARELYDITDIDKAEGHDLDVLGDIVGVSRSVPEGMPLAFFGFDDTPGALPYGSEGTGAGGRFYEEGEPYTDTTVLGDPEYRFLIRAKVVKNAARGTIEDMIESIRYIFALPRSGFDPYAQIPPPTNPPGPKQVIVSDLGGMHLEISIGRTVTYLERQLITTMDLLPRPAGVMIDQVNFYPSEGFFGFADQPGALGFGEIDDPSVGGVFAEKLS